MFVPLRPLAIIVLYYNNELHQEGFLLGTQNYLLTQMGKQILSSDFWFCPDGETKPSTVAERRGVEVVRVPGPPTI